MDEEIKRKKNAIEKFFLDRVLEFREGYDKLDEFEKNYVVKPHLYRYPCQVEVFWISEPVEHQLIIILHDERRGDCEVIVNGPFIGSEFIDKVDEIIKEDRWEKTAPYEHDEYDLMDRDVGDMGRKYSDFLVSPLSNFIILIRNSPLIDPQKGFRSSVPIHNNDWYGVINGNIIEIEKDGLFMIDSIHEAKKFAEMNRKNINKESNQDREDTNKLNSIEDASQIYQKIIGAYFYPPVRIGDEIELSFKEKLVQKTGTLIVIPKVEFQLEIGEITGFYDTFGFIGLKENNKDNAMNLLNTLYGVSIFYDIPVHTVKKNELVWMNMNIITSKLGGFSHCFENERGKPFSTLGQAKTQINSVTMKKIIETTKVAVNDDEIAKLFQFYLNSKTHQDKQEYIQAFSSGWLIIESYISDIFRKCSLEGNNELDEKDIKRIDKTQFNRKIEQLKSWEIISDEEFIWLDKFREKRNKTIHEGVSIDENITKELLERCKKILSKTVMEEMNLPNLE